VPASSNFRNLDPPRTLDFGRGALAPPRGDPLCPRHRGILGSAAAPARPFAAAQTCGIPRRSRPVRGSSSGGRRTQRDNVGTPESAAPARLSAAKNWTRTAEQIIVVGLLRPPRATRLTERPGVSAPGSHLRPPPSRVSAGSSEIDFSTALSAPPLAALAPARVARPRQSDRCGSQPPIARDPGSGDPGGNGTPSDRWRHGGHCDQNPHLRRYLNHAQANALTRAAKSIPLETGTVMIIRASPRSSSIVTAPEVEGVRS
jgi:hypothetical protein